MTGFKRHSFTNGSSHQFLSRRVSWAQLPAQTHVVYFGGQDVSDTGGPPVNQNQLHRRTLLQGPQRTTSCTLTSVEERLLPWSHFLTPTQPRGGVMLVCGLEPPQLSPLLHSSERPSSAGWGRPADTPLLHPGLSG